MSYDCRVFHDSGELWASGEYRMVAADGSAATGALDYEGFDGTVIFLKGGRTLVAIPLRSGSEHDQ
jgi:hypothetical protein